MVSTRPRLAARAARPTTDRVTKVVGQRAQPLQLVEQRAQRAVVETTYRATRVVSTRPRLAARAARPTPDRVTKGVEQRAQPVQLVEQRAQRAAVETTYRATEVVSTRPRLAARAAGPTTHRITKWVERRHAPCDPCDWCDCGLAFDHGDPYVFPAGVAEQEHVLVTVLGLQVEGRARRSARPRDPRVTRSSASRRPAPRAVRNGPGPVSRAFGALGRGVAAIWLGIAHGIGAGARGSAARPATSTPSTAATASGCFLIGLAIVVRPPPCGGGCPAAVMDRPHRRRRHGRQGRLARAALLVLSPPGAPCATPSATARPAGR